MTVSHVNGPIAGELMFDKAMGNLGYERAALDHYPTPAWVTSAVIPALVRMRPDQTRLWEPACGDGAMTKVLTANGYDVISTDLELYGFEGTLKLDFLAPHRTGMHSTRSIVTNPPYGPLAEQFIRQALKVTEKHKLLVAMILRHEYDCASGRNDLFEHPAFAHQVVLTKRPRWIPDSTGAPRHNYSWFIWDWRNESAPTKSYQGA